MNRKDFISSVFLAGAGVFISNSLLVSCRKEDSHPRRTSETSLHYQPDKIYFIIRGWVEDISPITSVGFKNADWREAEILFLIKQYAPLGGAFQKRSSYLIENRRLERTVHTALYAPEDNCHYVISNLLNGSTKVKLPFSSGGHRVMLHDRIQVATPEEMKKFLPATILNSVNNQLAI